MIALIFCRWLNEPITQPRKAVNRNEGDRVLDFFGGIMTVPYMAVKMRRYGIGIELNRNYFLDGLGYLKAAESEIEMPTLFDMLGGA